MKRKRVAQKSIAVGRLLTNPGTGELTQEHVLVEPLCERRAVRRDTALKCAELWWHGHRLWRRVQHCFDGSAPHASIRVLRHEEHVVHLCSQLKDSCRSASQLPDELLREVNTFGLVRTSYEPLVEILDRCLRPDRAARREQRALVSQALLDESIRSDVERFRICCVRHPRTLGRSRSKLNGSSIPHPRSTLR